MMMVTEIEMLFVIEKVIKPMMMTKIMIVGS